MKNPHQLKLIAIAVLLTIGIAACDKAPGPAESAGKQIDQTVNEAGKAISETVDKVGETMSDQSAKAADKVSEVVSDQSAKAGMIIDDVEITTKVKAAILAEEGLKTLQISVDTVQGVVTLSGSVDTIPNSETAKSLAAAVSGVTEVVNNLVVKPTN